MSTIALPRPTELPLRVKVAAGLALPLGVMNCVGAVVFWEWSVWTFVAVIAALMGAATVAGAVGTLLRRPAAVMLLRRAMVAQVVFTLSKVVFWQEAEAVPFGLVALAVAALLAARS